MGGSSRGEREVKTKNRESAIASLKDATEKWSKIIAVSVDGIRRAQGSPKRGASPKKSELAMNLAYLFQVSNGSWKKEGERRCFASSGERRRVVGD